MVGEVGVVGGDGEDTGIFRPHTEGTEAQSFLDHRGELALAGRAQRRSNSMRNERSEGVETSDGRRCGKRGMTRNEGSKREGGRTKREGRRE